MTTSLGPLLGQTTDFFKRNLKSILAGAVIFGVLTGFSQYMLASKVQDSAGTVFQDMGMDLTVMQELADRAAEGDQEAIQQMMQQMGNVENRFEGMSEDEIENYMAAQSFGMIRGLLPSLGIATIVMALLSAAASVYFFLMTIKNQSDPKALLSAIPGKLLPMIGLWIWVGIRSFVWIPILGFFLALYFGPRLALSPVILLGEGKGVFESASLSYGRTRGYWGKVFGNLFVVGLLVAIVFFVLNLITPGYGLLSSLVRAVVQQAGMAYIFIFLVKLSETVSQHPYQVVPASAPAPQAPPPAPPPGS